MIVTEVKRVILNVNKYHKQLWLELNDLLPKQVQNRVDSHHDSDRVEESHIKSK